uniref:Putative ubiquitin-conjugating enzyme e2 n=2 Tax=Triatoma infestans TaxID=30076 RepID=A0A023F7U9_TRIIF
MDFQAKYNTKIPAVKRLMREAQELMEPTEDYSAHPLDDNLFEWHFTVRGSPSTEFEDGLYHGRIILPNQYPMKPPNIILLTPNGRFETNKKICLSISGHHPETWQPSWSIRTALLALIAFMPTPSKGTIGSLDYTPDERRSLARRSLKWECPQCGLISSLLGKRPNDITKDESQLIKSVIFKGEDQTSSANNVGKEVVTTKEKSKTVESATDYSTSLSNSNDLQQDCPADLPTEMDTPPGFYLGDKTFNILVAGIVLAISLLIYRRLFLL